MAVLFVLHTEADDSSAEMTECGWCGPDARYCIYSDGTLEINGVGTMYDYSGFTHSPWYDHRNEITKIVIGDGITQLGVSAFIGLKHVTELTIPITINSVVSDVRPAFAGCYRIEKITFTCGKDGYGFDYAVHEGSNNWYQNTPWYQSRDILKEISFTDGIHHIGADAFRELGITSLVIPDSVTSLGCHCFSSCTELTDLTLPISLNSYGNEDYPAFQGCMAVEKVTFTRGNGVPYDYCTWYGRTIGIVELAPWNLNENIPKTIIITDDVPRLGDYMFETCNICELTLPVNLEENSVHYAFYGAYNSLEKVTLTKGTGRGPDTNPYNAEYYPWNKASNLTTIVIGEGVTHLGDHAFNLCRADTVVLPNTLSSFGECSFYCCNIRDLTLPISVNAAGLDDDNAFYHISGLERVTFTPGSGYGFDYAAFEGNDCWYHNTPWYQCWDSVKEIVFEDGIKHIGSDAFREQYVTSLTIPNSVESLGCHTFYNSRLTELTIPITLDSICSDKYPAFEGCNGITKLRFTAGIDGVGFDYTDTLPVWCTPLHWVSEIRFDSGITYIGTCTLNGYVFSGADGRYMETAAANLSGHAFCGVDGLMDMIDNQGLDPAVQSVPAVRCGPAPAGRV